jgi:hypothetical protein
MARRMREVDSRIEDLRLAHRERSADEAGEGSPLGDGVGALAAGRRRHEGAAPVPPVAVLCRKVSCWVETVRSWGTRPAGRSAAADLLDADPGCPPAVDKGLIREAGRAIRLFRLSPAATALCAATVDTPAA